MGGKRKRSGRSHRMAGPDDGLIDLIAGAHHAVERALDSVSVAVDAGAVLHDTVDLGEPCGPAPRLRGTWAPMVDPLLADRYQGLLLRSGVVGGAVHHLPSRLRERTEVVLRELVVGVARDRAVTGARVDALVDELLVIIGERIAHRVEGWRDPPG